MRRDGLGVHCLEREEGSAGLGKEGKGKGKLEEGTKEYMGRKKRERERKVLM